MMICIQSCVTERIVGKMTAPTTAVIEEERDEEVIGSACSSESDSRAGTRGQVSVQLRDERVKAPEAAEIVRRGAREDKARRWMWGFLIALGAMQIYYVQAMVAALFLFTLAFAAFAMIAFALYLVNRASEASLARVEPMARVAARAGRRTYGFIEDVSKKPFRRPHSETAQ
jgi:hypothetical protein